MEQSATDYGDCNNDQQFRRDIDKNGQDVDNESWSLSTLQLKLNKTSVTNNLSSMQLQQVRTAKKTVDAEAQNLAKW